MDTIPVSLALGQAAYESAYGTSRFAYSGNALFGQWSWGQRGMFPEKRRDGLGDYRIATFRTPIDSARAYANNLNTFFAYEAFRKLRAKHRSRGVGPLDGYQMAATMGSYSELREAYVKTLRKIIRENHLEQLNEIRLCECCTVRPDRMTMGWFFSDKAMLVQNN